MLVLTARQKREITEEILKQKLSGTAAAEGTQIEIPELKTLRQQLQLQPRLQQVVEILMIQISLIHLRLQEIQVPVVQQAQIHQLQIQEIPAAAKRAIVPDPEIPEAEGDKNV